MSRTYGRCGITYNFYEELLDTKIPRYKKDNRRTNWGELRKIEKSINLYLPEQAIELLGSSQTVFLRTPLRTRTLSIIPQDSSGSRVMIFPFNAPHKDNEYEYVYYLGKLLSNVNLDDMDDKIVPGEYDEVIPLLLEYLYVKKHGDIEQFNINYLNELKRNARRFMRNYNNVVANEKTLDYAERNYMIVDHTYAQEALEKEKNNFEQLAGINIRVISSFDALLNIIDKNLSIEEIKDLIDKLMTNKHGARETVIRDMDIDTFDYPRIRKELKKFKK